MLTPLVSLAISLSFIYVASLLIKRLLFLNKLKWIPGPPALPILGNYTDFIGNTPEVVFVKMTEFFKKYGKTYKVWVGSTPVIHCQDPDILQLIYKQEEKACKAKMYVFARQYLGAGLLMGEGDEKWKFQRKYLSDSFHTDILANNVDLTVNKIKKLIKVLDENVEFARRDEPLDIIPFMKRAFLDISVESITGVESKSLEDPASCPYLNAIDRMCDFVMARIFSPIFKYKFIFDISPLKKRSDIVINTMKSYIITLINQRSMDESLNDKGKHKIIVDAMLKLAKDNPSITIEDVESQVSNNILAAYDTMATVTCTLLFILGNDENLQEEVLKEVNSVVPNLLQDGITIKEANSLQLIDRCIKETLRMFPPAPMIGRCLIEPIVTKDGILPAGVELYTNMYNYHRNEEIFSDPDVFNPDRFLPENFNKLRPLSWIPFGFGIRACIGQKTAMMQTKVAVATMIKKYLIKSYEGIKDLELSANMIIKSKNGMRVFVKPRT